MYITSHRITISMFTSPTLILTLQVVIVITYVQYNCATPTYLSCSGSSVTRAHLLSDIIENIELVGDYYQKKTMTFVGRKSDKLTTALINKNA